MFQVSLHTDIHVDLLIKLIRQVDQKSDIEHLVNVAW